MFGFWNFDWSDHNSCRKIMSHDSKRVIKCHMEDNGMKQEGRSQTWNFSHPKIKIENSSKHRSHADAAKCGG
ncbi:hypothetical protein VNO78_20865 [Psophocarpus tetragonolobus]|uniref:Uncharacterized protein n=1 Tax=Psophocarpus tetragonolobus TaxID=3891 RepID=A0AAN9SAQ5_PSOTE